MAAAARNSADPEGRTIQVTASTGAPVIRSGGFPDGKGYGVWREVLDTAGARLDRFIGSPLLVDHRADSSAALIGTVETASRQGGAIVAKLRLGRSALASEYLTDFVDGLRTNFSLGYVVSRWAYDGVQDGIKTWTATEWSPLEISTVPIGADPGARLRNDQTPTNQLLRREVAMTFNTSEADHSAATLSNRAQTGATFPAPAVVEDRSGESDDTGVALTRAVEVERGRVQTIVRTAAQLNLSSPADRAVIDGLVDGGVEVTAARAQLINLAARRSAESGQRPRTSITGMGGEVSTHDALVSAVAHRINPNVPLAPGSEQYARMGMREIAAIAERDSGRGGWLSRATPGMHSTSDFLGVLSAGTEAAIAQEFAASPPSLLAVSRRFETSNLESFPVIRPSTAPELLETNEHGEIKAAPLDASFETMKAKTWTRMLNVSRNLILADRLDVITDFTNMGARSANNVLGQCLYLALTSSPNMADGAPFFATQRGNTAAVGTVLDLENLSAALIAMRSQKNGAEPANIQPYAIVCGPRREVAARQLVAAINAVEASQVNPWAGRLEVIIEDRIADFSWYVVASPARTAAIGHVFLNVQRPGASNGGPLVDYREGWEVLGLQCRIVFDTNAAPIEPKAVYRNLGAAS